MKRLFVPVCLFLILISCKSNEEKVRPVKENITESVYASGMVKSRDQYQAFPKVNGIVKEIFVTEGQKVKKGDSILALENETAQLNEENAKLSAEYASVQANTDKLNELRINIDLAKSKMENDSLLYERQKKLWENNIGSRIELEQRTLTYQNSSTAYHSALLRYNELKKQLNFSSKQSLKNLEISSSIAGDYTIRSEIDGRVYSILKEKGEIVSPQSPVAVIGDSENFILELQVDEYDISRISPGQQILITMDSYKDKVFEAVLKKIDPIMNDRSKSFTVKADFVTKPPALYPNLTVEANIIIQTKKNTITIPRDYLLNDSFVVLENKEKRKVVTGLKDYQKVEVIDGLKEGETILKPTE